MAKDWSKIYRNHKGKWIALKDDEKTVISSAKSAKSALANAQKKGYKQPILFRVPTKLILHIGEIKI